MAQIEKAFLDLQIAAIHGDLSSGDIDGKCRLGLKVPFVSLTSWQQPKNSKPDEKPVPTPAPVAVKTQQDVQKEPLAILERKTQELLKKWSLVVDIFIEKIRLDSNNHIDRLAIQAGLNEKKVDNRLVCRISGQMNSGTIFIEAKSDLNHQNPPWELDYRLQKVPYRLDIFRPLTTFLQKRFPIPIFGKLRFPNTSVPKCDLSGTSFWRGIDWRVAKKSLISKRKIILQFAQGNFDIGLGLDRFLAGDRKQDDQMDQELRQLSGQKRELNKQAHELRQRLAQEEKAINGLQKKGRGFWRTIDKLKMLISWNPFLKNTLSKYKGDAQQVEKEIGEHRQQQKRLQQSLDLVTDKLAALEKESNGVEKSLRQSYDRFVPKWNLPNPFRFSFSNLIMEIDITNASPWQGKGTPPDTIPVSST